MLQLSVLAAGSASVWPQWTVLSFVILLAGGVPTTLLAWLHFRLTGMHKEHQAELHRLDLKLQQEAAKRDAAIQNVYAHMADRYVQRDALDAKFETVNAAIHSLSSRVGDFVTLMKAADSKIDLHGERLAKLEAGQRGS